MDTATYFANPTILWRQSDIITMDGFKAIAEKYAPNTYYIKTDVLQNDSPIMWRGNYHMYAPAPVWISGHSDYGITRELYDKYKHNCRFWFSINKEISEPDILSLPIGCPYKCDDVSVLLIIGDKDIMYRIAQEPKQTTNLVYMNFTVNTNPHERQRVHTLLKGKHWVTVGHPSMTFDGHESYLRSTRNHTFAVCPRGNGVDTLRLWETLYMGTIPIVRRDITMDDFSDLPICWIDDWSQVSPEFLEAEYERIMASTWNFEKLKIGYWEVMIADKVKGYMQK